MVIDVMCKPCIGFQMRVGYFAFGVICFSCSFYFLSHDCSRWLIHANPQYHSESDVSEEDVYITVKTCGEFHQSRVPLILMTWWESLRPQVYFFTDEEDGRLRALLGDHLIATECGKSHAKFDLCCKFGHEFDYFLESGKKWWCHLDDDNYVNADVLLAVLREYDWNSPLYIGKRSRNFDQTHRFRGESVTYRFATGGAGIRAWAGKFTETCKALGQPDDVTFGFIVTNRVKMNLTTREEFNSHQQLLPELPTDTLLSQAILSYSNKTRRRRKNVIQIPEQFARFSVREDPSRLMSYHCWRYPDTDWCPARKM